MNLTWTNNNGRASIAVDQILSLCTILTYHKSLTSFQKKKIYLKKLQKNNDKNNDFVNLYFAANEGPLKKRN